MKRILSYVLTVIMVSALLVSVVNAADKFPDISDHWAKKEITYLAEKSILGGYEDGTFKPNGTVTRAEFIKMMTETFGLTETKSLYYYDVSTTDWFYPYIAKAAAQGFILDYGNGMSPNEQLTREEAAALLARYLKLSDSVGISYYPDYSSISSKYSTYVLQATKAGLFAGYEDGTFRPQKTLTRAEALTILYRAAGDIYTTTSSGKDTGANSQNAVISKGVTISDAYLEGNVYITEGTAGQKIVLSGVNINGTLFIRSSAEITFTNCTITNVVIESGISQMPTIKVYGSTLLYNLSVGSPANIAVDSKAKVTDMSILKDSANTKITGTGAVASLKIYTSGVTSEIVPTNYTIDSTYTAVFGGVEYTKDGAVAVGTGFASGYPYADEASNGYITLTNKTEKTGTIYYTLVAKKSALPDAKTIKADGYSVEVSKIKENENELKLKYTKLGDSDLAVVFVDENGNAYEPVRLFSKESSGFYSASVKGSSSGGTYTATYTLTSMTPGKAYIVAYRPDDVSAPTASKLISYAEGKTSSTKYIVGGVLDMPVAGTSYTYDLTLPSSYSTYEWETMVIFITSTGTQQAISYAEISAYKEDLTAKKPIEGNGFINDPVLESGQYSYPAITSLYDVVSFKTEETGKVYYYYTTTSTAPTAENFSTKYREASNYDSINVTGGQAVNSKDLYYTKTQVSNYTYIVFAFCDTDGNYYDPVVVARSATSGTGFSGTPTFSAYQGQEYLTASPLTTGTVYYYYSTSSSTPTATDFMTYYNNSGSTISGTVTASTFMSLKYSSDIPSLYTNIVIMFKDAYNNNYQPIVIPRTSSGIGGTSSSYFSSGPSISAGIVGIIADTFSFTPNTSGSIYTYISATPLFSITAEQFSQYYSGSPIPVTAGTPYSYEITPTTTPYYMYVAFQNSSGTLFAPVVISRP